MTSTDSLREASSARGNTDIQQRGIDRIVESAILSVPGSISVDSKLAGIAGRGYPRCETKSDSKTGVVAVDATIATTWPAPVTKIAEEVRAAIIEAVGTFTGYRTTRVNITVGETVPGQRVSAEEVSSRTNAIATIPYVSPSEVTQPVTFSDYSRVRSVDSSPVQRELTAFDKGNQASVRSVSAPEPAPLRSINTPQESQLRQVSAPKERQLRKVEVPAESKLRDTWSPIEQKPRSVKAPKPQPLAKVEVRSSLRPTPTRAPKAQPLRKVEVRPVEVRKPSVNKSANVVRSNQEGGTNG